MRAVAETVLVDEVCCACGVLFAMPEKLLEMHKTHGTQFFCPNGHSQHYLHTRVDELNEKIADLSHRMTTVLDEKFKAEKELKHTKKELAKCEANLEDYVQSASGA